MIENKADKWDNYFISVAMLTASLSYCKRLRVGAIAVRDRRIICTGYNGTLPGTDNCCEEEIVDSLTNEVRLVTKNSTEHAERNLIAYAARIGVTLLDSNLYITHAPCEECARAVFNSGFKEVYYINAYKTEAGIKLLKKLGVYVCHLAPYLNQSYSQKV